MFLAVFHQADKRVFLGLRGTDSAFGHTFGGSVDYAGLVAFPGQPPVHLLMRLNTADSAVAVALPGLQWLPLLCAIRYGACQLAYRVTSDLSVKIIHQTESKAWKDFPYDDYPQRLAPMPLLLEKSSYDPGDPDDVLFYAGVFGYDTLTTDQFTALARHVENNGLPDDGYGWESGEEYLQDGNCLPFAQGRPVEGCPDPGCANYCRASSLRTFAIFQENRAEARSLWGPDCGSLQIVYEICPLCLVVRTTNQST